MEVEKSNSEGVTLKTYTYEIDGFYISFQIPTDSKNGKPCAAKATIETNDDNLYNTQLPDNAYYGYPYDS